MQNHFNNSYCLLKLYLKLLNRGSNMSKGVRRGQEGSGGVKRVQVGPSMGTGYVGLWGLGCANPR